jgi:ABC-type transporter Mla subunit MlaD
MIGSTFGIGTPLGYPTQQFNPYSATSFGAPGGLAAQNPNLTQTLQQVMQLLQYGTQQLQQLQQLQYVQHQQLQQLVHAIPAQLQQLQQLIQFVPHQIQQLQQQQSSPFQQPFGQIAGTSGYGVSTPWGIAPQTIGAQSSHVM